MDSRLLETRRCDHGSRPCRSRRKPATLGRLGRSDQFRKDVYWRCPGGDRLLQAGCPSAAARPTPRWPDGKPRLGPVPGETGYWARPSSSGLKENGVNVQMDEYGLLKNISDAAKVAPFQPWARDLYVYRQRTFLKDDPMFLECYPPGALRQFQMPFGIQFLEDKSFQRIFVMNGGGNHDWHFIYTDGRAQQGDAAATPTIRLYYGNAVGKWEGDTSGRGLQGLQREVLVQQRRPSPHAATPSGGTLHAHGHEHAEV